MTKKEIIKAIEETAKTLNNGEYTIEETLTENLISNEEEGVIVEKDINGNIYTFIEDGEVNPVKYSPEKFATIYAN